MLDGHRHRVNFDSDDEFGAVARAFNAMQVTAERNEHALHAANRRLDFLALHDELTGLPNRRSFEEQLRTDAAAMNASSGTLAVHFIDLDDFKAVNDTLGHAAGDKLLRHVARGCAPPWTTWASWRASAATSSWCCRRDVADEPAPATSRSASWRRSGSPVHCIRRPSAPAPRSASPSMDGSQSDVVRLLSLADIALYEAKRENRGTISFLTSAGRDEYNRRRRMEIDIRIALEERQFTVFFQPQVSLDTGKPVGLEALVRWQHPVDGLISPADFLPLVDEMGLSARLGAVIIDEACRSARQLRDKGHVGIRVAINLSGARSSIAIWLRCSRRRWRSTTFPPARWRWRSPKWR